AQLPIELPLPLDDGIAHRAGLVLVLAGCGIEGTAAGEVRPVRPRDPAFEERAQALQPARRLERRQEDRLGELARRLVERGELELELRAEVGEKAALAEPGALGEGADGEGFEAGCARLLHGCAEDLSACELPLARPGGTGGGTGGTAGGGSGGGGHGRENRTIVRSCQAGPGSHAPPRI